MAIAHNVANAPANRLLRMLKPSDYEQLNRHLARVPLELGQVLYRSRTPIEFVYFFETGAAALARTSPNGATAEVAEIGNEGVVGLPLVLGDDTARDDCRVCVPGTGLKMKAALFKTELARSVSLQAAMLRYAHTFLDNIELSVVCSRFHTIEQRYCRWLLKTRDRMRSNEFLATQEGVALALGVQRTGVSTTASRLQHAGLIDYTRGRVRILNRHGLEKLSCDCYRSSKVEFDRLLADRNGG